MTFIILRSYQWSHHPSVGLCLCWNSVLFEIPSQAFTFECSRASFGVVQDLHLCRLHLSVPLPQGKPGRAATGRDAVQGGEEMMKGNFLKFHICKGHAFGLHLPNQDVPLCFRIYLPLPCSAADMVIFSSTSCPQSLLIIKDVPFRNLTCHWTFPLLEHGDFETFVERRVLVMSLLGRAGRFSKWPRLQIFDILLSSCCCSCSCS